MSFLRRLIHTVLVRAQRQETRPVVFDRERMISVDAAEGLFCRDGKTIALFSIKPARVRVAPTQKNPDRITLYRQGTHFGLCIYYYRDNTNLVWFSNRESLISINRDDIPAIRQALRKFTRTARSDTSRKPGKPFREYEAP
jgi:hypothetical protein